MGKSGTLGGESEWGLILLAKKSFRTITSAHDMRAVELSSLSSERRALEAFSLQKQVI